MVERISVEIAGKTIYLETGKLATQADGSVLVSCNGTNVLVTVVSAREVKEEVDFFPLTVDVEERMYAAGKIPGGFIKREGRPTEESILTARLIDRPLRPLFPQGFRNEAQVIATTLSVDQVNPHDVLAIVGASAALTISDIPFGGPIGAVRIGKRDDEWLINPTFQEIRQSELDMVVAGTREAIVMVEAEAKEISEEDTLKALKIAQEPIRKMIEIQELLREKVEKPKRVVELFQVEEKLLGVVKELATLEMEKALRIQEKIQREEALDEIKERITKELSKEGVWNPRQIKEALHQLEKKLVRKILVEEGIRVDGRKPEEIREISCEVGLFPRTHGSGLFRRGQTQVLTVLTLGAIGEEQLLDGLGIEESKRFLHQYNFPPFSVGEVGFLRGPRRREIGHGALAERALLPVIPLEDEFPYTLRLVSEVLESNGSTSMASVCGSTLALMDAGVKIKAPVAGIAMGLVKEEEKVAILSDIQGIEDACGDMDFKVAGTARGITALQMDIKITGVTLEILKEALERARQGRLYILDKMLQTISKSRDELSPYAPRIIIMTIPQDKIGEVIGPGGKVIKKIIEETGVKIDIEDDGRVFITSPDKVSAEKARRKIENLTKEIAVGQTFLGTVVNVTPFGAFVELQPGRDGLVHISRLSQKRVDRVEDVVRVGDKILVKVIDIDPRNRISLTALQINPPEEKVSI